MTSIHSGSLTRRDLFGGAMATAAGLSFFGSAQASPSAGEPIERISPSHLKLSLSAYSYRQYLTGSAQPTMDLFDFADLAAKMGFDGIEPTSYYFPEKVEEVYLVKLKQHAFLRGLDISGTAIRNDFCQPEGPRREADLQHCLGWIERAAILDAPVIRFFAGNVAQGETEDQAIQRCVSCLNEVLPLAAKKGVFVALENHGGITAEADTMLKIVEAIDHPNFGINLDTGNFRTDDPYGDLAKIAPYAMNVQVKVEIRPRGASKKQAADLARLIDIVREAEYSGYVVLEYEAADDPFEAIPRYAEQLRKLIS